MSAPPLPPGSDQRHVRALSHLVPLRAVLSRFVLSRPARSRVRALLRTLLCGSVGILLGGLALVMLLGHRDTLVTGPALAGRPTLAVTSRPPPRPASSPASDADGLAGPLAADRRPPAVESGPTNVPEPRLLQVARHGTQLVVHALTDLPHPGRYYAYAELWGGPSGQTPLFFSRRRWDVTSAGACDVRLVFTATLTDPHHPLSPFEPSAENHLVLRSFVVRSVDRHPSQVVAKNAQFLLFGALRIKSVPEGLPSIAQIPDGDRAADLTRGIQVPAGSSERRQ